MGVMVDIEIYNNTKGVMKIHKNIADERISIQCNDCGEFMDEQKAGEIADIIDNITDLDPIARKRNEEINKAISEKFSK